MRHQESLCIDINYPTKVNLLNKYTTLQRKHNVHLYIVIFHRMSLATLTKHQVIRHSFDLHKVPLLKPPPKGCL
jgi:hypothetical protein